MFKFLLGPAMAVSVSMTSLIAAPAQADTNDNVARAFLGLIAIAAIADAVKDDEPQVVERTRTVHHYYEPQRPRYVAPRRNVTVINEAPRRNVTIINEAPRRDVKVVKKKVNRNGKVVKKTVKRNGKVTKKVTRRNTDVVRYNAPTHKKVKVVKKNGHKKVKVVKKTKRKSSPMSCMARQIGTSNSFHVRNAACR